MYALFGIVEGIQKNLSVGNNRISSSDAPANDTYRFDSARIERVMHLL